MQDPVAQSGASSEAAWYQYGGARVAYTAVARPKQLYTGYGAVRDPALYGQAPATTQEKASPKKRSKPKAAVPPRRDPNCPPCPPADTAKTAPGPQSLTPQASPAVSTPTRDAAIPAPSPSASIPDAAGSAALPPGPSPAPLSGMPAAIPAPMAPGAPGP